MVDIFYLIRPLMHLFRTPPLLYFACLYLVSLSLCLPQLSMKAGSMEVETKTVLVLGAAYGGKSWARISRSAVLNYSCEHRFRCPGCPNSC